MKTGALIVSSVLLSTALSLGLGYVLFYGPSHSGKVSGDASAESMASLEKKLDQITQKQADLLELNRNLQAKVEASQASAARVSPKEIQDAVSRWIESNQAQEISRGASVQSASVAAKAPVVDLQTTLDQLIDPKTSWEDGEALWAKLKEAGLTKQAIAFFENRAKANPASADFQSDLGQAYIQMLQTVPDGPEKGTWAVKADKCFDDALALDEQHWNARFMKATSLAFWPPVFGKQNEAIHHFETLVQQQEQKSPRPHFAETYLFLGNMYQQQGNLDKAGEAWRKGVQLFPAHSELKKQVSLLEKR